MKENACLLNPCQLNESCIPIGSLGSYICNYKQTITTSITTTRIIIGSKTIYDLFNEFLLYLSKKIISFLFFSLN